MAESTVSVYTSPRSDAFGNHQVKVTAENTDHRIQAIAVWAKDGEIAQERTDCKAIAKREQKTYMLIADMFPLTIDITEETPEKVEEGSKEADSDTHRHGPFAADNNNPVQPGHRAPYKDGRILTPKEEEEAAKKK